MNKKKIVCFDFDGTITKKDTFLSFILFSKGKCSFLLGFLLFSPLIIAFKLKLYPNWKVKQLIFSYFYRGTSIEQFDEWCLLFSSKINQIARPKALEKIETEIQQGNIVIIVSASVENWIKPWANKLNISKILATKIQLDTNNNITGKFLSQNCYGKEKVNRIVLEYPESEKYEFIAYGDSKGDKEMIEWANRGWYNKFK